MSGSVREALVARFRRAPKAETVAESEPNPDPETAAAEPKPDADAAAGANPGTVTVAEPKPDAEPVAEPKPDAEAAAEPETVAVAAAEEAQPVRVRGRFRRVAGQVLTGSAIALVFLALIMPNVLGRMDNPGTYLRLPIELFVAVGLVVWLPGRWKRIAAGVLGAGLGVLTVLKIADMGFHETLNRPFDVILDWILLDDAQSFLKDAIGDAGADGVLVGLIVLIVAVLVLMSLAAMRITRVAARNRRVSVGTALTGTAVWVVMLLLGVQTFQIPVAARSSALYVFDKARAVRTSLYDDEEFAKQVANDPFANTPGDQLLTGLRGKDVFFTFIESYGRGAIEDPKLSPGPVAVLTEGYENLKKSGYAAKSGFLTSATFGGGSWLAHSTTLSGVWTNNQRRYRNLMASDRMTLPMAFKKAGFETISVMPGAVRAFPEGRFYGYDRVFDSRNTGYVGPKFGWSPQPDQYTLSWLEKNVHGPAHAPMMVEMPLVSSHTPWAPLPQFIDWDDVGDGSVYKQIQKEGKNAKTIWKDPAKVQHEYSRSVQYSLTAITDWLDRYGDENTVMVILGDHQASKIVTGEGASRDVPIVILAKDKKVLDKVSDWGWSDGLKPDPAAPVWRMDQFRDKFLTAFGPSGGANQALAPPRR
ncbi:sulfatase-like hydrolase/transferase [Actinoplanes sp. NPDC026623]|uniref:sulfatase-like hydrolase/transferase n=1 Tax=Actinoplanes sp. NPDC026623 TaxID=3155610 RepID=UPI0033DEDA36